MFKKIVELIEDNGLRGASLSMYIYPNQEFTIVPFGRSSQRKWIGSRNINYKIKGNISLENPNEIIKKIIEGFDVCINYENKDLVVKKETVESEFFMSGQKVNFDKYFNISIGFLKENCHDKRRQRIPSERNSHKRRIRLCGSLRLRSQADADPLQRREAGGV